MIRPSKAKRKWASVSGTSSRQLFAHAHTTYRHAVCMWQCSEKSVEKVCSFHSSFPAAFGVHLCGITEYTLFCCLLWNQKTHRQHTEGHEAAWPHCSQRLHDTSSSVCPVIKHLQFQLGRDWRWAPKEDCVWGQRLECSLNASPQNGITLVKTSWEVSEKHFRETRWVLRSCLGWHCLLCPILPMLCAPAESWSCVPVCSVMNLSNSFADSVGLTTQSLFMLFPGPLSLFFPSHSHHHVQC